MVTLCDYVSLSVARWRKQAIMAKMFEDDGNAGCTVSLSLRELLEEKGQPQIVLSTDTVRTAGKAIARGRKAVSFHTGFHTGLDGGFRPGGVCPPVPFFQVSLNPFGEVAWMLLAPCCVVLCRVFAVSCVLLCCALF